MSGSAQRWYDGRVVTRLATMMDRLNSNDCPEAAIGWEEAVMLAAWRVWWLQQVLMSSKIHSVGAAAVVSEAVLLSCKVF